MTPANRPSFTVKMAVSDRNDGTRGPQLALGSAQGQVGAACSTTGLGLVCGLTSSERRATQRSYARCPQSRTSPRSSPENGAYRTYPKRHSGVSGRILLCVAGKQLHLPAMARSAAACTSLGAAVRVGNTGELHTRAAALRCRRPPCREVDESQVPMWTCMPALWTAAALPVHLRCRCACICVVWALKVVEPAR